VNHALRNSVFSGLRWTAISRVLTQLFTWTSTFLVVRLLAPSDYGLAAMATLLTGYLAIWNELGFSVTLVQRRTLDVPMLRKVFGVLIFTGLALFAITYLVAPLVALGFKEPAITPLTRLAAIHFLMMPLMVIPQAQLSIGLKFKQLGLVNLGASVVGAIGTLTLAYFGYGAYALVIGTLIMSGARVIGLHAVSPFICAPDFKLAGTRDLVSFSGLVLLSRTIWYLYDEADIFIVGRALHASKLGFYSLGRQLAVMPMERASEIFNAIALPAYSSVKDDLSQVARGYLKAVRLGATISFAIFWGMAVVADDMVRVLIGEKWAEAIPVIQLLCLSMPLRTLGTLATPALTAGGRPELAVRHVMVPAVLIPAAVLIGVRWGISGVALAWTLTYPVAFFIVSVFIRRALGIDANDQLRPIIKPAIAGFAMCAATYAAQITFLADWSALPRLLLTVPLGAAVYIAALWLVARDRVLETLSFGRGVMGRGR